MNNIEFFIKTALRITAEASEIPRHYFRADFDIEHKQDKSPVTIADQKTEQFIRNALEQHFPEHAIFGEEFGRQSKDSEYEWIIDPIDGTRSFVSGMPLYGMLIALLKNMQPQLGIIRMPQLNEVYVGDCHTATLNQTKSLHCSEVTRLRDAIVYINEGEKINQNNPALFKLLCATGRVMRLGYDCYPHALLASGQVDLVIDYDLKPYDYFSLIPVVKGAGGVITDWQGKALTMQSKGDVVSASTIDLHRQALDLLNG